MTTISAKALLVSRNASDPDPNRKLSTVLCRYPRWIHAEGRTHRLHSTSEVEFCEERTPSLMEDPMLSRNASSSRAIPVEKLIKDVISDPAVPLFWGSNQKGMQAGEECNARVWVEGNSLSREEAWEKHMWDTISMCTQFASAGYHKQIVNRLLESFSHITVVVSATEWNNFFALRIHEAAEPHIRLLAERIKEAIDTAPVQELQPGEWHLPFITESELAEADAFGRHANDVFPNSKCKTTANGIATKNLIKLSMARCASTSYKTVDGFDMTQDRAIALHDRLVSAIPIHASPAEHVARADQKRRINGKWLHQKEHRNFVGFRQYRAMLPGERQ